MLFSQTFYGLLFSYLTITDVTSYVDHTVHLAKSLLQTVLQMLTKKITLARFACLRFPYLKVLLDGRCLGMKLNHWNIIGAELPTILRLRTFPVLAVHEFFLV